MTVQLTRGTLGREVYKYLDWPARREESLCVPTTSYPTTPLMSEDSHLDLEPVMSTSTDSSTYSVVSHPNPKMPKTIKVAAVQAEPVWNDLAGGVEKVCAIINTAAKEGTNVIGFPEVFIPGYPW